LSLSRTKGESEVSISINDDENPADLLWGAAAIAAVIGRSPRATFYMLESGGLLPARKVGGRWVASRRKLLNALAGDGGAS
jgi:hypothetical protein